jgi:IstB-like ATP binding protein
VLTSNKGFEEWGDIFGDEVMAAALIDRLVHHCHLVTIRGNSYRLRQHTELWQALHGSGVRRSRRTEARPLVDLSDFRPAELSDFHPALTAETQLDRMAFLRFVISTKHADSGVEAGLFTHAYQLRDAPETSAVDRHVLFETLAWFEKHVTIPDRFNRSTSKGHYRQVVALNAM